MLNITIIGMGLIGASLGMAIREANEKEALLGPTVITGYDQNRRATGGARGRLAIDREARSLEDALRDAQLVITAVPVQSMHALFSQIAPLLPNGAVVSDVASTKTQVLEWARELLPITVEFIGGHPMGRKEQTGGGAAGPHPFKGAVHFLPPPPPPRQSAINFVAPPAPHLHPHT